MNPTGEQGVVTLCRFPRRRRDTFRRRLAGPWGDEILENSALADAEGASGPTAISQAKGQNVHIQHLLAGIWQMDDGSVFFLIGTLLVGVPMFLFSGMLKSYT